MRALIIEDQDEIADVFEQSLNDMAIASDRFARGAQALEAFRFVDYDLLILDLTLPDIDGLEVLRKLRTTGVRTPVLIVSARIRLQDRVAGLDLGADDYLVKPFDLAEFEARVRALLRRDVDSRSPSLTVGGLSFDQASREFRLAGRSLNLSPRERSVLEVLIRQKGGVISKERIAQHTFSFDDEAGVSSIELYIHRLRKKLVGSDVTIQTHRGLGYALLGEADQAPC